MDADTKALLLLMGAGFVLWLRAVVESWLAGLPYVWPWTRDPWENW